MSVVQQAQLADAAHSSGTPAVITVTGTGVGNWGILLVGGESATSPGTTAVTDNASGGSNTWTKVAFPTVSSGRWTEMWVQKGQPKTYTQVTVTCTVALTFGLSFIEESGVTRISASNSIMGASTSTPAACQVTPDVATTIEFSYIKWNSNSTAEIALSTVSITAGWTLLAGSVNQNSVIATRSGLPAGTANGPTFVLTGAGTAQGYGECTIALATPFAVSCSDSASPSDSIGRTATQPRAVSETASPSDSIAYGTRTFSRGISDTASPADSCGKTQTFARANSDSATPADSAGRSTSDPRAVSETATPSDSCVHGSVTRSRNVSDTASPTDSAVRSWTSSRGPSDIAAPVDTAGRSESRSRAFSDTATPSDSCGRATTKSVNANDTAAPSDAVGRHLTNARSIFEVASPSDLAARAVAQARAVFDIATPTDVVVDRMISKIRFDFTDVTLSFGFRTEPLELAFAASSSMGFHAEPLTFREP